MSRKFGTQNQNKDALVISIQSWMTPFIALMMLAVGFLGGYYLRGLQQPDNSTAIPAAVQPSQPDTANPASAATTLAPTNELILATPITTIPSVVASPTAGPIDMDTAIALTRHFQGDPNAPVTLIEFSDFQ